VLHALRIQAAIKRCLPLLVAGCCPPPPPIHIIVCRFTADTLFGNKSAEEAGRAGRKAGTEKQRQGGEWYLDRPAPPKSLAAFQQKTGRTLAPGTTGRQLGGELDCSRGAGLVLR
jgi:hypothetical protein